jgi:hypothetical protein
MLAISIAAGIVLGFGALRVLSEPRFVVESLEVARVVLLVLVPLAIFALMVLWAAHGI